MGIVEGQIAHIDRDASNASESNLAFLCLNHHNEYDTKKKQSKNLTPMEVRRFKRSCKRRWL
jgi:hypothetical protein